MNGSGLDRAQPATAPLVKPLGVGFPYIPVLSPELYETVALDFVEVVPETLCREWRDRRSSIAIVPSQLERAKAVCLGLPIVVHGVELSIGSAHGWNTAYLQMLDSFQKFWPFLWHSEHLGFQTFTGHDGTLLDIGVPLPLPCTCEVVRLISDRCSKIHRRYGVPFLLENPAHYLAHLPRDPEIIDEIDLMNQISGSSTCGHLLDLHNLYCNAINHKFDARAALSRMTLERVVEIHVAGGSWLNGFWMDAHDGRVPNQVWELLEYALPLCPNVAGVVFEILGSYALRLGIKAITEELAHVRQIWRLSHPE
ncbi:MAG: DUF692 family protein [Deltaproteobacteria bacterium]|nr:DUF692 family protein [Deltaproteobacteria bacterium]